MSYLDDVANKRMIMKEIGETENKEKVFDYSAMWDKRLDVGLKCLSKYDSEMADAIKDNKQIKDRIANILFNINALSVEFFNLFTDDGFKFKCSDFKLAQYKKFLLNINTLILPLMFSRDKSFLENIFIKDLLVDEGLIEDKEE